MATIAVGKPFAMGVTGQADIIGRDRLPVDFRSSMRNTLKHPQRVALLATAALALMGPPASTALAEATEATDFSLGIGYAYLSVGDSDSELHAEDAIRFDAAFTFAPIPAAPQLRLGAAFGLAAVLDNSERTIISNGGLVIAGSNSVPLLFLEPELRLSWRQYIGDTVFIEPGIGVGGVFGHLDIDDDDDTDGQDNSFSEWDQSVSGRAFVNLGFEVSGGIAGFQASYMRGGELDFAENASGEVEEFYIGFFGGLQF